MSEQSPHPTPENEAPKHETHEKPKKIETVKQHENTAEHTPPLESEDKIRHSVEDHAETGEDIKKKQLDRQAEGETQQIRPNKQVKDHARETILQSARRHMPKSQQKFSKFIHKPVVEQISDAASETIARPSGLLFGGIFSLLSSLSLLIICYYYGYSYNFLAAIAFFGGGFLLGTMLEALVRVLHR